MSINHDVAAVAEAAVDQLQPGADRPSARGPSRATVNFLLDGAMLVAFLLHFWVVLAVEFVFPAEADASAASLWGMAYAGWSKARLYTLCGLAVLILVHLVLHWTWICGYITTRLSRRAGRRIILDESARTLYGVGTLIVILSIGGLLLLVAELAVKTP